MNRHPYFFSVLLCKCFLNKLHYLKNLLAFLAIFLVFTNLPAQESRVWDYPIHYGTPEWDRLSSFQERLKTYNIPDDLIKYMTTADLVRTCLNYPEWLFITSSNNFQTGYNSIKSVFNGFVELEKRPDAFKELYKVYIKMKPEKVTEQPKKGQFTFEFSFIELLLSQKSIISSISNEESKSLLSTCQVMYENKCKNYNIFSSFGLSTTCLIVGRILEQSNSDSYARLITENPETKGFIIEGPFGPHKILLDRIIESSKEYIRQL